MDTVSFNILHSETKRKQEIRFSKIDSIEKVLNAACKVFKIEPENHELSYAKKKLDLNMNLMSFDLPDGATLEVSPVTKAGEKTDSVTVNLIIGDGTVNAGTFQKSATLWDVTQNLIPKDKFLEEDRICISFLSKRFNGEMLKKIPLSSLKLNENPLNLSLNRKYSSEKLNVENDKESIRRSIVKAGTSKASINRQDSVTKLENIIMKDAENKRKKIFNSPLNRNLKNSANKPEVLRSRILGNTVCLTDNKKVKNMIEKSVTTNLTAKADVDKHFYLNPEKKLKDLKYLSSRQGITYVYKQPLGEISREESAVDLLDLARDSTRSSDGNIELKIFLPDETAIQAMFKSDETIDDVFNFVNPLLQCQPSDYFLYTSNPTESVEKETFLHEFEDSSGINLYFSLQPAAKKKWHKSKPFLKDEYLPKKD